MELPLLLQFSIALFTGMVAATFVPPVRKAIPRPAEIALWVALVTVCVVGVTSIADPNARELSSSAAWGADQIFNTLVALLLGGVGSWIFDHRFPIASWLVIVAGADIFLLMFINSMRSAQAWRPRVRLREWMELPLPAPEPAASGRLAAADPLGGVNRRLAAMSAVAGNSLLSGLTESSLWVRDVHARALARRRGPGQQVESRSRLDSLRDASAHLNYAARSWYAAAGEPAINGLASRTKRVAMRRLKPVALKPGEVIDIQALLSAQSIGWYGPLGAGPATSPGEKDAAKPKRSDRLAS